MSWVGHFYSKCERIFQSLTQIFSVTICLDLASKEKHLANRESKSNINNIS